MIRAGKVVAADSSDRTITIQCDEKIGGVTMGSRVLIQDEWPAQDLELADFLASQTKKKKEFERVPGE